MTEEIRVAAFFDDERQRKLAEETLTEAEAFNNVVEGAVPPNRLEELINAGLIVEPLEPGVAPTATTETLPDPAAVEGLAAEARRAELVGDETKALEVREVETEEAEPRIHADQLPERPTAEEALPEDVYHLRLTAPITREQRLEFDSFGVDIAAFEPPDRYRAFLTPDQYIRVKQLPYVADVTRYGLEESVTQELIDEIASATTPRAGFAAADTTEARQEFDCVVHRERDLDDVRALIENTEGVEVRCASNLRVRFEAPVSAPLLGALASLPEVHKLAPFTPPML